MSITQRLLTACAAASLFAAPSAFAAPDLEPVLTERGNVVLDSRGNCVRTRWMAGEDICNPTVEPVAVVQPAPKVIASKSERTVYFEFDKSNLTIEAREKLDDLSAKINNSQAISSVYMVGYTDQIGTNSYNQALSERRVNSVRSYLDPRISLSIDPKDSQFLAAGEAPEDGKCDGAKNRQARIECLSYQRRVEVRFTTQDVQAYYAPTTPQVTYNR